MNHARIEARVYAALGNCLESLDEYDEEFADRIRDYMDHLWHATTPEERADAERLPESSETTIAR